jgi:hypothetical protein
MKKYLLLTLSSFIMAASFGQVTIRIGKHEAPASWTPSTRTQFASTSEAKFYAQEIIDVLGLKPNFEVMAAKVDNAAAVVYGGKRYVLYNPDFINALVQKTGNKWAAISVLAHEIGHHLNGHTVTGTGSQPAVELEADEFSGFVLRKMGATLADAQAAMKVLANETASATHPAKYDRLASIAKGWQSADGQSSGKDIAQTPVYKPAPEVPAPVVRQPQAERPARRAATQPISANQVLAAIRFIADPHSNYYVTTQYNVVRVQQNQLSVIGKLARSNNSAYPYMIYDQQNNQLLVDTKGTIVNMRGRQVGKLTSTRG